MFLAAKFWLSTFVSRFRDDERGQGMVEYGLILALVAVVVIGALIALGGSLGDIFNEVTTRLENPGGN